MKKSVIITGGTSGFGLATAKAFVKAGYEVMITARHEDALLRAKEETGAAFVFKQDVTDYGDWVKLRDYAEKVLGKTDVLVNNAGGGLSIRPIEEQSAATIENIVALNLTSVIYGAQVFAPVFKAERSGTIINLSSVCAKHAWSNWSVYAAAKAGVLSFTKGLQVELQPYGVRATCVIPASCGTGFQSAANLPETSDSMSADDIASAVLFAAETDKRAIVEEITVWGMSQIVQPL